MESFGGRLRYERERRQINLRSIAETTKIAVPLLEGLERDDVSRWPSGIFRKSFIRSYAEAIGLDPEPVVREFIDLFPDPLEADFATPEVLRPKLESAGAQPASSSSSSRPLSVKLTITWSGSPFSGIGKVADWKIVRMFLY
jgi:transcriptional regulator with XRE-family HTH domain